MKKVILIIFSLSALPVMGQNQFIGIMTGINLTNTTNNFVESDFRTGFSCGMKYEYLLTKSISLGAGVIYNQRGFRSEVIFRDEFGNPTGQKSAIHFNYDYLSVPIRAGVITGKKVYGFANLGIIPSVLINAKTFTPAVNSNGVAIQEEKHDVTKQVTKFDLAGLLEIGGGKNFGERYSLFGILGYQQSFTSFANSNYFANSNTKHYGVTLSLGLKYALAKE